MKRQATRILVLISLGSLCLGIGVGIVSIIMAKGPFFLHHKLLLIFLVISLVSNAAVCDIVAYFDVIRERMQLCVRRGFILLSSLLK